MNSTSLKIAKVGPSWSMGLPSQTGQGAVTAATSSFLPAARLRGPFHHWREASASSSQQRGRLTVAAEHHRRQLLGRCLERWKQDHLSRIRVLVSPSASSPPRRRFPLLGRGSIGGRSSLVKCGLSTGLGFHWGNPLKQWSHLGVLGGNEAEVTVCIWENC